MAGFVIIVTLSNRHVFDAGHQASEEVEVVPSGHHNKVSKVTAYVIKIYDYLTNILTVGSQILLVR